MKKRYKSACKEIPKYRDGYIKKTFARGTMEELLTKYTLSSYGEK